MPLSDKDSHLSSDQHKQRTKQHMFGVKIVVNIYLIKQDISKVKFIYRKINKESLVKIHEVYSPVCSPVQLRCLHLSK